MRLKNIIDVYEAYSDGQNGNTYFQPEGAMDVACLVFKGLKDLKGNSK